MGDLEQIELLEEYIDDFGKELKSIKKASDYLSLIEEFQVEVSRSNVILDQSKDHMAAHQELATTKFDLYQSILHGIEHKQKLLEESQGKLVKELLNLTQKQDIHINESKKSADFLLNIINENQKENMLFANNQNKHQSLLFKKLYTILFTFLGLSTAISIAVIFILLIG